MLCFTTKNISKFQLFNQFYGKLYRILIKKYFIISGKNSFFSQHFFQVEGCEPIYLDGVCCPVKYICGKTNFYTIFIWLMILED